MSPPASCPCPSPRLCFAQVQKQEGWGPGPRHRLLSRLPAAPGTVHRAAPRGAPPPPAAALSAPAPRRLSASPLTPPADSASRVAPRRVPDLPPALSPSPHQGPWGTNRPSLRGSGHSAARRLVLGARRAPRPPEGAEPVPAHRSPARNPPPAPRPARTEAGFRLLVGTRCPSQKPPVPRERAAAQGQRAGGEPRGE